MPIHRLIRATLLPTVALCIFCAAASCAAQVSTTVTVTDTKTNAPVPGLPRGAFAVSDGKTPQEITSFNDADEPASVAVLFDLSSSVQSMGSKKLKEAVGAFSRFVRLSHSSNEYSVVAFADEVLNVLDASSDPEALAEAFRAVSEGKFGKHSSLFDACWLTIPKLARGAHAKRVLILVTDGVDTYSRAREDDITRQLKENNVVVYSINVGDPGRSDYAEWSSEGRKVLENLSKVSGGLALAPRDAKEVGGGVERIAAELRGQYVIGFRTATPLAAGKCLKFKMSVTPPAGLAHGATELTARSREDFCAPRPNLRKK